MLKIENLKTFKLKKTLPEKSDDQSLALSREMKGSQFKNLSGTLSSHWNKLNVTQTVFLWGEIDSLYLIYPFMNF